MAFSPDFFNHFHDRREDRQLSWFLACGEWPRTVHDSKQQSFSLKIYGTVPCSLVCGLLERFCSNGPMISAKNITATHESSAIGQSTYKKHASLHPGI